MLKLQPARVAAFGLLALATACAEPVDCHVEPQRCPRATVPAAAAKVVPSLPPAREQVRVAVPQNGGQRLIQAPLDPGALGRMPIREPLAGLAKPPVAAAPLPEGAPSADELKGIIASVLLPTKARDFEALKPFITARLYDTLTPLLAKDGERLWRHLSKYQTATEGAYRTEVEAVEADNVRMHLTLHDGSEMRPILTKQNGVWKIDRF